MIDPARVAKLLVDRVAKNEDPERRRLRENLYEEVVNYLLEVIDNVCKCNSYEFESETTLDHDDDEEFNDSEDESLDPDFDETKEDDKLLTNQNLTLDFMKKVIEFYDARDANGRKKHTWKSTKHQFRSVPHQQYITRFRYYIEQNGTKREKIQVIEDFVYDRFEEARNRVLSVHDHDLRRWALQKAAEDSVLNFQASEHWVRSFKHRHRICSRKITNLVTRHQTDDSAAITASADPFLADVKREMNYYAPNEILNTDQIGLELEMHSTRTLSYQGEKVTLARIRSKNATTHSYTIQPMISLAGQLVGPIYLCLKEPKGKMSDNVKRKLFSAPNVVVTCSSSGKLTTSSVEYWRDHVLRPFVPSKSLLLSDYWSGQRQPNIYSVVKGCKRLEIPAHTTSRIQPLDVYFNRQWKVIARRIFDHVQLDDIAFNLSERSNIIRLNSLIHNQLSTPLFVPMIKYAWFESGYVDHHPGDFKSVHEVCFDINATACQQSTCRLSPFIQCSHCRKVLCFEHFFEAYHFHN